MSTFSAQIKSFSNKVKGRSDVAVRKICADIHEGVVLKTPVDTGRTRSSWNVGINGVDDSIMPEGAELTPQAATQTTMDRAKKILKQIKAGKVVFVSNNTVSARVLNNGEYPDPVKQGSYLKTGETKHGEVGPGWFKFSQGGYSKQAPNGMVELTLQSVPGIVFEAVQEAKKEVP